MRIVIATLDARQFETAVTGSPNLALPSAISLVRPSRPTLKIAYRHGIPQLYRRSGGMSLPVRKLAHGVVASFITVTL